MHSDKGKVNAVLNEIMQQDPPQEQASPPQASVVPFPSKPAHSRIERDFERSIHAEAIARELSFAVYRAPWYALETAQQIRLRNTAIMAIRSLDPQAQAVARSKAVEAFEDDRSGAVITRVAQALTAHARHLTHGLDEPRPTPAQDAAYDCGVQTHDTEELTGHGRY